MSRGRRIRHSTRDIFILLLGGQGADYLRGCILEHQIFRFAKMILRDRCSTSYDLAALIRRWSGRIAKQNGTLRGRQLCTQLSIFKEVLQNCFVFDILEFESWGSLPDLLRSSCSQFPNWGKSRRMFFFMLSTRKIAELLQDCFMIDRIIRQT